MNKVTAVLIGAGLRGSEAYASYALEYPNELEFVAVAEPDDERRKEFSKRHKISEERQYKTYEELLANDKMADCALVCTQDKMHYEPVIKSLELGYHVLCEKPMSPERKEIVAMGDMAKKYGKILSICHVLRYSPFFIKIKQLLEEKKIGRLISIQHIEEVGYWHYAHSFVRGNWRSAKESSPMILAKCCHDMDILSWLVDSECVSVGSMGELTYFRKENAPEGATEYCMDGCVNREKCPYYAPRFYMEHPKAYEDDLIRAVSTDISKEAVLGKLKKGQYGRCIFHCDNTVVDHQVVNLKFKNEVDVSFEMCVFTKDCKRKINLMGTYGQIIADMKTGYIELHDFITGHVELIKIYSSSKGHNGSDAAMMRDFVAQVAAQGGNVGRTSSEKSVESHLMALAAETARVEQRIIDFKQYREESLR